MFFRNLMKTKWTVGAISCVGVVIVTSLFSGQDSGVASAQQTRPEAMQVKLSLSQELLEKLTLEQYEDIAALSDSLLKVSMDATWMESRSETYDLFAQDFIRRVVAMRDAAHEKNLSSVTLHYTSLIQTCVECHDAVRGNSKLALNLEHTRDR